MLSMIPAFLRGVELTDLETIKTIAREAYPDVPQFGTGMLAQWLEKPDTLLLIDVRSAEEFAVSHLRGAVNLQRLEEIAEAIEQRTPGRTVLYCSVGFRSSRLAHRLWKKGLRSVANLDGSIFQWANEGRAVFQGERRVQKVHPYGKRWAGLLMPGLADGC
jgi:rhodanese-related sulfurtransferase